MLALPPETDICRRVPSSSPGDPHATHDENDYDDKMFLKKCFEISILQENSSFGIFRRGRGVYTIPSREKA